MSTPETATSNEPADETSEPETAAGRTPDEEAALEPSPTVSSAGDEDRAAESETASDDAPAASEAEATAEAAAASEATPDAAPAKKPAARKRTQSKRASAKTAAASKEKAASPARTRTPRSTRKVRAPRPKEVKPSVLSATGLVKRFGATVAVDEMSFEVPAGSFFGIVGPNGAGKTTTMSMMTGLLRPDAGAISVNGIDVWTEPEAAKREMGVLPDRLRLFDRLTGWQLLHYSGTLRGLAAETVKTRAAELVTAFGLDEAAGRLVADYSAGMTKKIALACAMIHAPRVLVLDEPFEAVDPVSAVNLTDILKKYVAGGGTVVLSSHSMELVQRECDRVVVIVDGRLLAEGTMDEVRAGKTLEDRFIELAGGRAVAEDMEWLHSFSD